MMKAGQFQRHRLGESPYLFLLSVKEDFCRRSGSWSCPAGWC